MDSANTTQVSIVQDDPVPVPSNDIKLAPAPFDEATFLLLEVCVRCWASGLVALVGLFSNTVVLIVFYRQGIFSSSSTVSLTMLGLLDLVCCVLNIWGAVSSGILFHDKYYYLHSFWVRDMIIFVTSRPMDMLTQCTCWVTAFAGFERLISVVFPFKVKSIFTPMRSCIGMTVLSMFLFLLYCPALFSYIPRWNTIFWMGRNLTHIKYFRIESTVLRDFAYYTLRINTLGLKTLSIAVLVFCNATIYWKVNLSQKFRSASAHSTVTKSGDDNEDKSKSSDKKENKEMRLLKMITVISIVFVVCYTPFIIFSILVTVVWEWRIDYHPFTEYLMWAVCTFLQTINSSTNFFIYYIMSSRFREEFQICCSRGKSV